MSSVDRISPEVSPQGRTPFRLLTQREVASEFRVTPRTVRRWDATGLLCPVRIGGITRYHATDIEDFIRARSTSATTTEDPAASEALDTKEMRDEPAPHRR